MRYQEFRDAMTDALREAGLMMVHPATETIDLESTARHWRAFVVLDAHQRAEPFHVGAEIAFDWDPFESARTYTTEADLVRELFSDDDDLPPTLPRHLRTDIVLRAGLMYGSRTPMPPSGTWRSWSRLVDEELATVLPTTAAAVEDTPILVLGWRGSVEVESGCSESGDLCLKGVSLPSWRAVVPPRVSESSDDEPEGDIAEQLSVLAELYAGAVETWAACVEDLSGRIHYRPPT